MCTTPSYSACARLGERGQANIGQDRKGQVLRTGKYMVVQSKYVHYFILFRVRKAGRENRLTLYRTEKDRF